MLNSKIENAHWAEKNYHNALWHYRNSHNAKFRVVAVFKQPQRVVACEDMPWCESRVVAVKGNDHIEFGLHENTTRCRGRYLLQPRRDVRQVSNRRRVSYEWSSCKLVFFTAMSVDSVKIFNDKVKELNDASSHRGLLLDIERYINILWDVKEAQILWKNNQPLTSKHYRRLKR